MGEVVLAEPVPPEAIRRITPLKKIKKKP